MGAAHIHRIQKDIQKKKMTRGELDKRGKWGKGGRLKEVGRIRRAVEEGRIEVAYRVKDVIDVG